MATIKVEVTYDPKKETLSQALASLLTEKPEHTETNVQMSLFDNPAPTETPAAQKPDVLKESALPENEAKENEDPLSLEAKEPLAYGEDDICRDEEEEQDDSDL